MTTDNPVPSDAWFRVDTNLLSLRRHLQLSKNEVDYQAIGVSAREAIISLAQAVASEVPVDQLSNISDTDAKAILGKYFDHKLAGSSNQDLRSYSKSCLKFAIALQHDRSASYTAAEICTEACAHLVVLVRILFFEQTSPPNERYRYPRFASAESVFITSWLTHNFNTHPVAIDHGFSFKAIAYNSQHVTLLASRQDREYAVTVHHPYWWRGASRISAEALIDEALVRFLTELDKEHFRNAGQPPA